jgi:plastocyanin
MNTPNAGSRKGAKAQRKNAHFFFAPLRLCVSVCIFLLAGCGKSDQTSQSSQPVAKGAGIISGQVFFDGTPPERKVVSPSSCWVTVLDDTVLVNPNGTLKNVMVYLKDAPPGDGGGPPVILDQHNALYQPKVVCLQVGEPLILRNSDPQMHNVHIHSTLNQEQNFAMMDQGSHDPIVFSVPEFFKVGCDVHPWMDAEVGVFDHPYFAVTGDDGTFIIRNVPPGHYILGARHELYGELTQPVDVADQQTFQASFRYKQPASIP